MRFFSYGHFNSQPHEEADHCLELQDLTEQYFNSQPHEEADGGFLQRISEEIISTHSLTKRLTAGAVNNGRNPIFQLTASRRG